MAKRNSLALSKFFEELGTPMRNVLWSWCAHSPERKRAVFTVWAHLLIDGRYVMWEGGDSPDTHSNGGREMYAVLRSVMAGGDEALGVICYVKDATAKDWKRESYVEDELLVLKLIEESGMIVAYVQGSVAAGAAMSGQVGALLPTRFAVDDIGAPPPGVITPDRVKSHTMGYVRDDQVRRFVLNRARGLCEYCGASGFELPDGQHYLEAHHVIGLSKQGPDTVHNVIALCPSHHREAHYGKGAVTLEQAFVRRLLELGGSNGAV